MSKVKEILIGYEYESTVDDHYIDAFDTEREDVKETTAECGAKGLHKRETWQERP